jgi:hypothetical protein
MNEEMVGDAAREDGGRCTRPGDEGTIFLLKSLFYTLP